MLELLVDYARKRGLSVEPGFAPKSVRWLLLLDGTGRFQEALELGDVTDKKNRGEPIPRAPELSQPELISGGGRRHFLVDNAEVVALLSKGEIEPKARAKHAAFVALLAQAAREALPELAPAVACLDDEGELERIRAALAAQKAAPTDNVTVAVDGEVFARGERWHAWWRGFRASLGGAAPDAEAAAGAAQRCLASGELAAAVRTNPKIRGLADVGGLPTGDVLASFDKASFASYGFEQGENAPISEGMAAAYRAAIEDLLAHQSVRLAGLKAAHWYQGPAPAVEDDPFASFVEPPDASAEASAAERARALLDGVRSGTWPRPLPDRYHALFLSGASGRVMVRELHEGSFEQLCAAQLDWFEALAIVRREGDRTHDGFKLLALLGSLVRELKDLPAAWISGLWRAALGGAGAPIPETLAAQALARVRSDLVQDNPILVPRLALLKAFLVRKGVPMKPGLDPDYPEPAYQLGRLMAALAAVQYAALGDVGAGVVQRYYAAASATPGLVFGRLLRGAQYHLEKLDGGLRGWHQARLAEISARLPPELPANLDLLGQSQFALGYYQQIAQNRADAAARKAERAEADASQEATHG
jgi:CRISPR-associated protein Csd1